MKQRLGDECENGNAQVVKPWSEILGAGEFRADWEEILAQRVRFYQFLGEDDRRELKSYVRWFIASKPFEGCEGLEITDEIRVTVAAQACLLLLHRETPCYERLRLIRIYPGDQFAVSSKQNMAGECWGQGIILLAWDAARMGAADPFDGDNLVLHEFAHQLDYEDGASDGTPFLSRGMRSAEAAGAYASWARMLSSEYEDFRAKIELGNKTVMDSYGATDPAEFFAVATECFFEKSVAVRKKHPALYAALKDFYRQDPASWAGGCAGEVGL
jgi:Mlc titration factor MtfA (ptsG expression regulator)